MTKNHETGGTTGGPPLTLEQRAELFRSKEEILQLVDEKHAELESLKKKLAEQEERLRKMGKVEISEGIKKVVEGNVAWPDIMNEIYREVMKIIDDVLIKADTLLVKEVKKREVLEIRLKRYEKLKLNVPVIYWKDANYEYDNWVPKEALELSEKKLKMSEKALADELEKNEMLSDEVDRLQQLQMLKPVVEPDDEYDEYDGPLPGDIFESEMQFCPKCNGIRWILPDEDEEYQCEKCGYKCKELPEPGTKEMLTHKKGGK